MKILFAVHTYYPDNNGFQKVTEYLAEGLSKQNEVAIITSSKSEYAVKEEHNGILIYRIETINRGFEFIGDRERYFRIIEEFNPEIFVCVCVQSWPFDWIKEKINLLKCKTVLYTHGASGLNDKYPLLKDLLGGHLKAFSYHFYWKKYYKNAYAYMKFFDRIIYLAEGDNLYQYAISHGLKNGRILGNAVDEDLFCEYKGKKDEKIKYIYISNYDDNKNQKAVLRAYYEANIINSEMVFAGGQDKQYFDELVFLNSELGKEFGYENRVTLLFGVSRDVIKKLFKESDVFVLGSKKETYSLVLCEAAASGKAIISTDVGIANELPGCYVVENFNEMKEKMELLANNKQLIDKAARSLKEYAENNFRIDKKIEVFDNIIYELVGKKND